jgi:hypothetical protein
MAITRLGICSLTVMPAREQRLLLVAALGTLALVLLLALAGHPELLAYVSPLLVVAVPLLAGRYVGEQALERLRTTRTAPRPRPAASSAPAGGRRAAALLPRGGRLIAHSLAERGPPAPALS